MILIYTRDHAVANAYGYIANSDHCENDGTVQVLYCYLGQNIWYDGISAVPYFCLDPCCDDFITHNTTVYFLIQNSSITHVLETPTQDLWGLLVMGIIALGLGFAAGTIALISLRDKYDTKTYASV